MSYKDRERKAAEPVVTLLALPDATADDLSVGDVVGKFIPWDLFPSLYGSYSSDFDEMAIGVLERIRDGSGGDYTDLAAQMFREMLCTSGLCDYGTSPRSCWATEEFKRLLPQLIERWKQYAKAKWGENA